MLKFNEKNFIKGIDIYEYVDVKTRYTDWIKRCIEYADLVDNVDFFKFIKQNLVGRPTIEYEFTINAAKEMCIVSATPKAKELRRWLISISEQRENLDLLTHDEVVMLAVLEGFFKYVENQKSWFKKHLDDFASKSNANNPYAKFHNWRNSILNLEKNELDKQIKQYCVENQKRLPKLNSSNEKIRFLNEYDSIRNAVWDFLSIKGEVNALKLANLVKRMAEAKNTVVYDKNEDNLFQQKENIDSWNRNQQAPRSRSKK